MQAQCSEFAIRTFLLELCFTLGPRQPVIGQAQCFAGAALGFDQPLLLALEHLPGRFPVLQPLAHQVEFVAQRIDAQRRIGRRAGKLGGQRRLVQHFGRGLLERGCFVDQVHPFAIDEDQPVEYALAFVRRQVVGGRRAAVFQACRFLLAAGLGQQCLGVGPLVAGRRRLRGLGCLALGFCGKQVGNLRLRRTEKTDQRCGGQQAVPGKSQEPKLEDDAVRWHGRGLTWLPIENLRYREC